MACENVKKCPCTNTGCERHATCCLCVAFHRDENGNLPVCLRPIAEDKK